VRLVRLKNRLLARVFTAFPALAARWGERLRSDEGAIPWAVPRRRLADATVALVTTGGVHLASQSPFVMGDPDGDPSWREIPVATRRDQLIITHDYYDHRDAENDLNLVLPVERFAELVAAGAVGALFDPAIALMGHIDGRHLQTLREGTAPAIAHRLVEGGVDYALLVPA
jgi:D-proline reductase (dithiol) PrdB